MIEVWIPSAPAPDYPERAENGWLPLTEGRGLKLRCMAWRGVVSSGWRPWAITHRQQDTDGEALLVLSAGMGRLRFELIAVIRPEVPDYYEMPPYADRY